jgi:hypothetical protein
MTRELTQSIINNLEAAEVQPLFAVELYFDTQTLYMWTGIGDLVFNNITYVGTGQFLEISELRETAEISAKGATVSLSGIPSNLISLAISEPYQGRKCKILFGLIDANRQFLKLEDGSFLLAEDGSRIDVSQGAVSPVVEVFNGYIDQMVINEGADTSNITISVESRLIDLERARIFRFNDQNQKARYPTDRGFEFVEDLQDKKFNWGRG